MVLAVTLCFLILILGKDQTITILVQRILIWCFGVALVENIVKSFNWIHAYLRYLTFIWMVVMFVVDGHITKDIVIHLCLTDLQK